MSFIDVDAPLSISTHARKALRDRGFGPREVAWVLAEPEQAWLSRHGDRPQRWTVQRGPLAVVLTEDKRVVITVLLRYHDQWDNADARRLSGG